MLRTALAGWVALAVVCVAGAERAEDEFSRGGCYLGASGSYAIPDELDDRIEDQKSVPGVMADDHSSWGAHGRAGCRGRWVGAELHYEWLDGFDVDLRGVGDKKLDAWMLGGDLKFYPLPGRFQPVVILGLGYLRVNGTNFGEIKPPPPKPPSQPLVRGVDPYLGRQIKEWDFAARMGLGLELYATRNIALNLDATFVRPLSNSLLGLNYFSFGAGVLYRF